MPIGTGAKFVYGGIYQSPYGPPASFHNDQDLFVVTTNNEYSLTIFHINIIICEIILTNVQPYCPMDRSRFMGTWQ